MPSCRFGVESELSLPDEAVLAGCGVPRQHAIADPAEAVRRALRQPIEFPPLQRIAFPGDRIVLALEEGLVKPVPVVTGIVLELLAAGIEPEQIQLLRTARDARLSRAAPTRGLPADVRERIEVHEHDPADRPGLCLLNVAHDDRPIYLSRQIVEADLVLPIGVMRPRDSLGYLGVHGALFPTFADQDTQRRFLAPRSTLSGSELRRRRAEAREAAWMLGVRMTLQLIPGRGEALLHVLAGDADAVEPRGRQLCDRLWHFTVPRRASLVVATMPGGRQQQSWANFARVLDSALRVVKDDGAIAVCCDLRSKPGRALKRVARADSLDSARRAAERDRTYDALPAVQLIRTLQRARVYLLSRLDEDVVESLGVVFVACPEEVARLASHHDSCILLQNAHHAVATVADETPP
jgi:nickel-dependent lactate racemase